MAGLKTIWERGLTEISETDKEGVGRLRIEEDGIYLYVQNKHGSALTVGQVCFFLDTNTTTFMTKVYDGLTGDLSYMAGVVMATSLTADYFGWIQIFGVNTQVSAYASGLTAGMAIVVGDSLIGSNGSANAFHGAATGTAPLHTRHIIALEALATSITVATAITGMVECM